MVQHFDLSLGFSCLSEDGKYTKLIKYSLNVYSAAMGNKVANNYWEAELPPNYDRVGIENFIRAK